MKRLKGLNEVMKDFKGQPILAGPNNQTTSMKDLLTTHLGMWGTKEKDKAIKAFALGIKLNDCQDDEILLENSEFDLLTEAVVREPKMTVFAMAPVFNLLEDAETVDPNKKT